MLTARTIIFSLCVLFVCENQAQKTNETKTRMGNTVPPGSYPYNVAIMRGTNVDDVCGGALLKNSVVITAASCIVRGQPMEVVFNAYDLHLQDMNQFRIKIQMNQIEYDGGRKIALIKMKKSADQMKNLQAIELGTGEGFYANEVGIITGWDRRNKIFAGALNKIGFDDCKHTYTKLGLTIDNQEMCAKDVKGCSPSAFSRVNVGDPLMYPKDKTLVGIVSTDSWIMNGYPVRFYRLTDFAAWINSVLTKEGGGDKGRKG